MIKYQDFRLKLLLESVMMTKTEFEKFIGSFSSDNKVASILYSIIHGKKDIKTNYNGISLSDKNDEISFIPDSQFQRAIEKGEDPWSKSRSKSKIGRMIRQVLSDNGHTISDSDIEKFVNAFKAKWDRLNSVNRKVSIVKGDDILYWYNEENYLDKSGTLGNSCMRFESRNNFMRIYADNPEKVSMVILTEDDKLIARALIWKLDESSRGRKIYLDRIYVNQDSDFDFICSWVLENVAKGDPNILRTQRNYDGGSMKVKLNKTVFEYYPYADTFCYLYKELKDGKVINKGFLTNERCNELENSGDYLGSQLQDTCGSEALFTHKKSEYLDKWIPNVDAVFIGSVRSYMPKSMTKYCKALDENYLEEEVIFSEKMDDYIPKDRSIEHPKFGIVLRDFIVSVIEGYKGDENPVKAYNELLNNDYKNFITYDDIKTSKNLVRIGKYRNYFDKKIIKNDYYGDECVVPLSFELFSVYDKADIDRYKDIIPYENKSNNKYITKLSANIFNIKVTDDKILLPVEDYIGNFSNHFYFKTIEYLLKMDDSKDKEEYSKLVESVHKYKLEVDRSYRAEIAISDAVSKNLIKKNTYIEIVKNAVNNMISEYRDNWRHENDNSWNHLLPTFNYYSRTTISESDMNIISKLILPFFLLYFDIGDSQDTANDILKAIDSKYPSMDSDKHDLVVRLLDALRRTCYRKLRYEVRENFDRELESISSKIGNVNTGVLRGYLYKISDIDIKDYIDL